MNPPPPSSSPDPTTEESRDALERERARARRAGEDARRAERELLESRANLRAAEAELGRVRTRLDGLQGRPSVRLVTGLLGRAGAAASAIRSVARRGRSVEGASTTASPVSPPARTFDDRDTDPRELPRRYREALLGALRDPAGQEGPFRVALAGGDSRLTADLAGALTSRGLSVVPLDAGADAVIALGQEVDPASMPAGTIRIGWYPGAGPEFDIAIDPSGDAAATVPVEIERWLRATRVGIRIPAASAATAETWGDTHLARAFRDALRAAGWPTRLHVRSTWDDPAVGQDDVVVDLLGLHEATTRPGAVHLLWQFSHPELARPDLYDGYDLVFVASDPFAALMAEQVSVPVRPLHQATDPERFRPTPGGPAHELLFAASWRQAGRRILEDLLPTDRGLAVYGGRWTPDRIDPAYLGGGPIPNQDLASYYSAASIVLNDHWAGMQREGFLSNRLYDASAAGAFVISDDVDGLETEFDGGVVGYRDRQHLRELIEHYLEHPEERRERSERARDAVLARHTFAHRARDFAEAVQPLLPKGTNA